MVDVLEEVAGAISREHVEKRLADWEQRIRDLYAAMSAWLPEGWISIVDEAAVPMHEEVMREVGLSERRLPSLRMHYGEAQSVYVEPRVLWIIGANGRLVVRSPAGLYFISDRAELFQKPDWRVADFRDRGSERILNSASLREVLTQADA